MNQHKHGPEPAGSRRGWFITFEGVEGCGKSTQIERAHDFLKNLGLAVDLTREPGGTPLAESIRGFLLDPAHTGLDAMAELLLYEAARAQHVAERIRPALKAGVTVLCDRFSDSTTAYQGAGRGLDMARLLQLHAIATGGLEPDLTLVLDVPVELGMRRTEARGGRDRIEQEPDDFHHRVRQAFLDLAKANPERMRVVDGTLDEEAVAARIRVLLQELLH
ncbi:MAG: dTMP kinase [Candidatus Hydrogenedentes bacterium]|nr:dTMP kinase [Candidatus Hydrogenedentota bacterium]